MTKIPLLKTYCFVAGVSGGHILPALNLAHDLQKDDPNARIIMITTHGDLDAKVLQQNRDLEHHALRLRPVPYRQWYKLPLFAYQAFMSFAQSLRILYAAKPARVITTGSHIALPVCAAAWILRIPIELVALDVEPGKTLLALAPLAATVTTCFEPTQNYFPKNECVMRPYPLSTYIRSLSGAREQILNELAFDPAKKTLLIVGGSQGSVSLNNAIKTLIAAHPDIAKNIQIIHQTGSSDSTNWPGFYAQHGITAHAFAYNPELVRYYLAADCIITRAGSGSLHEIMYLKKPCIIIPLITNTTHHQRANAQAMRERHPQLVQVIEQEMLGENADVLFRSIERALLSIELN
jgi:UDP-N-acetylglucosamine--N-acetylmuramyl-(pentapeptide) pyrophosphoryl-undecaprenol N-acetylglucosamine transferase